MTTKLPTYKKAEWEAKPTSTRSKVRQAILQAINKAELQNEAKELTLASVDLEETVDKVMKILGV